MVTQTVEFRAPTGQTITAKLFAIGSDTEVSSVTATEATNRKGTYAAAYSNISAGTYDLIALVSITPVAKWCVDLTATTSTFHAREIADSQMQSAIYNASPTGGWTNGSFGDRLLVSSSAQRTVAVTGSNHIAADVHAMQTDVIDANALAASAVTEIQSGLSGTGARTVTITVNDGTTVLQNARVRVVEGSNTYTGLTNANGIVVLNLDDATYTVSITKSGYTYSGTTLVVDGTETRTYSMSIVTVTPPSDPSLCAVTFHLYDQYGADQADEPVEITFVKWEDTATSTPPVVSVPPVLTTDNNGVVSVDLYREATYKIVYGSAPYTRRVDVTIPDAGTYTVEI